MTINHNRAEVYKAKEKGVERGRPKKKKKRKKFYREIKNMPNQYKKMGSRPNTRERA